MSEWTGLRYWNEGRHNKDIVKYWKVSTPGEFKHFGWQEMHRIYGGQLPGKLPYTDGYEKEKSFKAVQDKTTNYKLDDVVYTINDYGFRGDWELGYEGRSIGFFGCSFTFGIGVADYDMFPTHFARHLNCQAFNFGVPGGSTSRAVRYYSIASKLQKFNYVVFMLPHAGRFEMPYYFNNGSYCLEPKNMIPNWPSINKDDEYQRLQVYKALDDNYLAYDTIRAIDHAMHIAKTNNTQIYFTSWDMEVYDILYDYLGESSGNLLPWFHAKWEGCPLARDGAHPGPDNHTRFFRKSIPYLK